MLEPAMPSQARTCPFKIPVKPARGVRGRQFTFHNDTINIINRPIESSHTLRRNTVRHISFVSVSLCSTDFHSQAIEVGART